MARDTIEYGRPQSVQTPYAPWVVKHIEQAGSDEDCQQSVICLTDGRCRFADTMCKKTAAK